IKRPMTIIERSMLLRSIDMLWVEHIDSIDHMRQGIGLRGYGQKDPLVEYKKEAHRMFQELLANIRKQIVYSIYKIGLVDPESRNAPRRVQPDANLNFSGPAKTGDTSSTVKGSTSAPVKNKEEKVGRNDLCPCGSGKKYKKCCGA
ncbi:MAG: SEC-C metal-binding domain-containing protein, partial [Patescibacteria group bacterium]